MRTTISRCLLFPPASGLQVYPLQHHAGLPAFFARLLRSLPLVVLGLVSCVESGRSAGRVISWGISTNVPAHLDFVVVSNAFGAETSLPATLTVTVGPPLISGQPTLPPGARGDDVTLEVHVDGSGPLQYQWWFNGALIPGATNATLSIPNASYDSFGVYTVTVVNPFGAATSEPLQFVLPDQYVEYEFEAPNGPLVWDFSGWYPALGAQIFQNHDGGIAYDVYGYPSNHVRYSGRVTESHGSVGFTAPVIASYTDPADSGYWWICGLSLDLQPAERLLRGFREFTVMIPASLYSSLRQRWYPHYVVPGINYFSELVTVPLSGGVDGHWQIALSAQFDAARISGTAAIRLAETNVGQFEVSGAKTTVTKSVMNLQIPLGNSSLDIVTLGPEMALQSMHGTVAGQSVDYDAPPATNTLSLEIFGPGTVTSLTHGQALVVGRDYTLKAKPRPGNLFSNWVVSGIVVADATLHFTMCAGLTIMANFGTNRFIEAAGIYNGLFHEADGVRPAAAGFFTLTLGSKGAFSGSSWLDGGKHSFSGRFDLSGQAQVLVRRGRRSSLTMSLQLDPLEKELHGTVTDGNWISELSASHAFSVSADPGVPYEGVYTMAVPGGDWDENFLGDGFIKFWIDYHGKIHATGTLADGTHFTRSTRILQNGQWPFYVPLYGSRGSILSWITLTNRPVSSLGGGLVWFKPSKSSARFYPAGFTNQTAAIGSTFLNPAGVKPHGTVNVTNGVVVLAGGNLPFATTNTFQPDGSADGTNRIRLRWSTTSGAVSGSFIHPATRRSTALQGVLLQNQNSARGFFLGTNQSGSFLLQQ